MINFYGYKESYTDEDVEIKTVNVYQHIYSSYYGGGKRCLYNSFVGIGSKMEHRDIPIKTKK